MILMDSVVFSVRPVCKILFNSLQNGFFFIVGTKRPAANGLFPIWQQVADSTARFPDLDLVTREKKGSKLFIRRRFIYTFIYGIAQCLLLRLEFCTARRCTGINDFTIAGIKLRLSALSGTVLLVGYFLFCRRKQINLMQSFSMTKIHDILQEIFEKISGYMMLEAGFCVTGPFRKSGLFHIKHTKAVEDYVDVNISGMIGTIRMCADQDLMSGKILFGKSNAKGLSFFSCQFVVDNVLRIETQNVVMGLDLSLCLIFVEFIIELRAFCIKKKGSQLIPLIQYFLRRMRFPFASRRTFPFFSS